MYKPCFTFFQSQCIPQRPDYAAAFEVYITFSSFIMSQENPIAKLGDLTKPATVLIEKISEAVGGVFKPYQIVRVAKAEAEVGRIQA